MRVAILLALLVIPRLAAAQTCAASPENAAMSGVVWTRDSTWVRAGIVGARDSLVLGFATIHFPDLGCKASTDRDGRFTISRLPAGTHRVVVNQWGTWLLDTAVTLRAGATLFFDPRLARVPDPLTFACPEWPTCERLPADTSLNAAAVRTLVLLAESEDVRVSRTTSHCLSIRDSTGHPVSVGEEWLAMGGKVFPMTQCARNAAKQYLAPGGSVATGWYVEQKPRKDLQPKAPAWEGSVLYFLTADHPPLLISTWSCMFERGSSGWRAAECAPPLSDH